MNVFRRRSEGCGEGGGWTGKGALTRSRARQDRGGVVLRRLTCDRLIPPMLEAGPTAAWALKLGASGSVTRSVRAPQGPREVEMAATAAANAPMWLTRESEVLEHLFHATAEIGEVWVEYGGQTHGATLSWPDRNARIFGLFLDPSAKGVVVPPPGSVVRVRYASQGAVYAFLTSVERAEAQGSWVLHFPRSVQRSERRAVERRAVHGLGGFRFEIQGEVVMSFPLYDISPMGLGYVASRAEAQVRPGTKVSGWLCLPDQTRLAVEMELRHIRSLPGSRTAVIVGCRFLSGDAALTQEIEAAVAGIPPIWD